MGQPYTSRSGKVASYKTAVFLQLGVANYVHTVSSSSVPGERTQTYSKADGQAHTSLSSLELCDILKAYSRFRRQHGLPPRFTLVLDNDPSHKGKAFRTYCKDKNVTLEYLPPRSHDLSPLDSHFFGVVKNNFGKQQATKRNADWRQRCEMLRTLLEKTDSKSHISSYKLRLEACAAAKGQCFEDQLHKLKRQRR